MENGEEGKAPASAFEAMRKRFQEQEKGENSIIKPAVTPKPKVGKLGGGGELNIFATSKPEVSSLKPGVNRPGNIGNTVNKPEPVTPRDKSPNPPTQDGPPKKRNSSISIPSAFLQQDSPAPPPKPKPKVEPKSKSDANNNADQGETVTSVTGTKPALSPMKLAFKSPGFSNTGNTSPRDGPQTSPRSNSDNKSPRGGQVSAIANAIHGLSPADLKKNLKPMKPNIEKSAEFPKKVPVNIQRNADDSSNTAVELRKNFAKFGSKGSFTRRSVKSVIRSSDSKKFRKADSNFENSGEAPAKPDKLEDCEVDFDNLIEEFKKQLKALGSDSTVDGVTEVEELEEEEEYDDIANVQAQRRAVSIIQPMTEEDEMEWDQAGFPGLEEEELPPPPEELYDDGCSPPVKPEEEDTEELYEALPDEDELPAPPPPVGPNPPADLPATPVPVPPRKHETDTPPPAKSKESKETDKERKKREKEEKERKKKEEQLQQKKEQELKKMLKSFEISAEDMVKSVGKGTIKKSAKAGDKKSLAVTEGEKVDIIRMQNSKAKGKWLVRLDNTEKVGYVEADNIAVDTEAIRSLMEGSPATPTTPKSPVQNPEDGEEMYEPVDELANGVQGYEEDEIYEECN